MKPIVLPIEDSLDLHVFRPGEVPQLLEDYLAECLKAGIYSVRIVHGKGAGILKKTVHRVLSRHPGVASFKDAPPEAGGWGATLVELKKSPDPAGVDHRAA